MTAKVLYWDIETAPLVVHAWGLRDQNIAINQIRQHPRMIGFGSLWEGEKRARFYSEYHQSHEEMVVRARDLLDEADAVVSFNGQGFDTKHANAEFVEAGLTPPSPYKHIDLFRVVKKNFRWPSYKLAYVSQRLGIGAKLQHTGHQMWIDCLEGDEETKRKAWALMSRYCRQDVQLLPDLKERLLPWLGNSFNPALYIDSEETMCQKCGSTDLESRGTAYTALRAYPQFRCRQCGGWTRDVKSSYGITAAGVIQ